MKKNTLTCFLLLLLASCNTQRRTIKMAASGNNNILEQILQTKEAAINAVVKNSDTFRLQIIYTRIDRDKNNKPAFTDYTYNLNAANYFYPASTVKMPAALLALEKLHALKKTGLDKDAIMITDSSFKGQDIVFNNPATPNGEPSIANYIKQIFLVSDNDAFNRLYEFLGQQYINEELHRKGFNSAHILHRLSVALSEEQNRHTNKISFYDTAGNLLHQQDAQYSKYNYPTDKIALGKGFYSGGSLVNQPFNFSVKNRFGLQDLHNILRTVLFPEVASEKERFNLTENDYNFLYHYMSAWPRESKSPVYDSADYHDSYAKFLLYGSEKGTKPGNIRIFNKIGQAYGFLTDVAYIIDLDKNIEFMLSATLLCNSDGIFNDDKYDYTTVGFPFMKALGEAVYQHEEKRKRSRLPDLSKFKIDYVQ